MSPFDAALPSTEDLFSVIEAIHDNVAIVDHNGVMAEPPADVFNTE